MQQKTNHCLGKSLENLTIEFLYMAKDFFFRSQISNISPEIKRERRVFSVGVSGWMDLEQPGVVEVLPVQGRGQWDEL